MENKQLQADISELELKPLKYYAFLPGIFLVLAVNTPFVHVPKIPYLLLTLASFVLLEVLYFVTVGRSFVRVQGNTLISRYLRTKTINLMDISMITAVRGGLLLRDKNGGHLTIPTTIYSKRNLTGLLTVLRPYLPVAAKRSWRLRLLLKSCNIAE